MSEIASHFTKAHIGAAACAMAVAAVITPGAVAAAKPEVIPAAPVTQTLADAPFVLAQILPTWWSGTTLVTIAPSLPGTPILEFKPLSLLPGFVQPILGFVNNINLGICAVGLGAQIGPYGTVSVKRGSC